MASPIRWRRSPMLGTFRLLLALMVAASHANARIGDLNGGVIAVVCFYLISGYVMTGLIRKHYATAARLPDFYMDRTLRIVPQYAVIAMLTLAWFLASGQRNDFLRHVPGFREILANVAIVPLNYFMFNGIDQFTLIPPSWSLGAEVQFYVLIPLLLLWRIRSASLLPSAVVFGLAAWGTLNSEIYGYRLLPGVLTFFLLGSLLFDARHGGRRYGAALLTTGVVLAGGAMAVLAHFGHLMLPYNRETLLGVVIGLPLLYWLGGLPQQKLDNRLGDLSYGVFLNHFLLQWTIVGVPHDAVTWIAYLGLSLVLSAVIQKLVEQPVLRWRRRLRDQSAARQHHDAEHDESHAGDALVAESLSEQKTAR